ncbi:MAG: hypothetical protein HY959_00295 [Ignavibacteriae bacterium]|nr:hypothetical protein [Ignavibacteriota bacterium]
MFNNKKKAAGIIIFVIGFVMILTSALNYIFKWEMATTPYTAIGIINIAIGTGIIKKANQGE